MMEEDVFVRAEADGLTRRIADRLGERQQKLEQMEEWERQLTATNRKTRLRPLYAVMAVAACIAAVVLLWPTGQRSPLDELGIAAPELTEFRGASPETERIEQFIKEENYEKALAQAKKALKNSDLAIYELEGVPELWDDPDEAQYEEQAERLHNAELRWTYIYLLVHTKNYSEARKQLRLYLKQEPCEHGQEARELLKRIK